MDLLSSILINEEVIKIIGHVLQNANEVISNNYDSEHQALDIVSSDHTQSDVIALESGIVETVVKNVTNTNHNTKGLATYGNYVKIKQTNGKTALYAHMKYGSINVNIGDFIEKGAIIGTMGSTGNAYGNHLHLEIKNENGIKENPLISLNEQTKPIPQDTEVAPSEEPVTENIKENKQEVKEEKYFNKKDTSNKAQNTTQNHEYLNNSTYKNGSIVDALKEINIDSSYSYRKKLATANDITNYHGSYDQNVKLLKLIKEGKLKKA